MRPGPHPWAENDLYVGGPDIGSDSKTQTLALHREDGYYRARRLAPDILNWQLNREHLSRQSAAKMMAGNYTLRGSQAIAVNRTMGASLHMEDPTAGTGVMWINLFYYLGAGAGNLEEHISPDGANFSSPASNPVAALANACNSADADADDSNQQRGCVAAAWPGTDLVYTANGFGGGAWGVSALGAPGKDWLTIGCDRNTAGGANAKWLIGDSGNAAGVPGAIQSVVYASTNAGANYAVVAGFTALALGINEQIRFIGHTCHPVGALGPDDAGNPSWLILTDTQACYSADGVTWANVAHTLGAVPGKKQAAYSRTARRWVAITTAGAARYSDDGGATWVAGVLLPGSVGTDFQIKCDMYGTFVVFDGTASRLWVSVDDGITWTQFYGPIPTAGFDTKELEVAAGETLNNWDTPGNFGTYFGLYVNDDAAPLLEAFKSLMY